MIRNLALVLFLLIAASSAAQKQRIGILNVDSLYRLTPDYQACADSMQKEQDGINRKQGEISTEIRKKEHELDSVRSTATPLEIQLRTDEIKQIRSNWHEYKLSAEQEMYRNDSICKSDFNRRLDLAKKAAMKKYKCTSICSYTTAQLFFSEADAVFVDLNAEVARELGID